jgi:hypothetical protein
MRILEWGAQPPPAVVFDALVEHLPPMFPARALETAPVAGALPPIVQPKMKTGKEFPSASIRFHVISARQVRFPSSPSIVRLAL